MTTARTTSRYSAFAITAPGLSGMAARELTTLGIPVESADAAGVSFETDARGLCLANVHLRTVSRIVVRLDEFRASTFHELEKRTARIDWPRWLAPGREVSLRVTCRKSRLYHSGAVAERVAGVLAPVAGRVWTGAREEGEHDGIGEAIDAGGPEAMTPATSETRDAQLVVIRMTNDRCTISLDSSGALLHQRGYRQASGKAPLRETLGAALLLASGWQPGTPLVDPFCGSGTLVIEGAMLARRMAPGRGRSFAVERWPQVDASLLAAVRDEARERELPSAGGPIAASDRDAGVIEGAKANAERAGVSGDISFATRAVSLLTPPNGASTTGALVTNPPYGVRVGDPSGELRNLYARLGAVLRANFAGWRVAIVSADRRLTGQLGVPLRDEVRTSNGGLAVTFTVGDVPGRG